jgi:hypothetical protein
MPTTQTVLGSIPASNGTVESDKAVLNIVHKKEKIQLLQMAEYHRSLELQLSSPCQSRRLQQQEK